MKSGVVLAGGTGSRLMPLTKATNKHLLPIYNVPMIYAPIRTLASLGCSDIIIVAGGDHVGDLASVLQDGSDLGVSISYRVQKEPDGIGGAIKCVEGYIGGLFPIILGDNYFYQPPIETPVSPTIYTKFKWDAKAYGVYVEEENIIVEKPTQNISPYAVTGLYIYDDLVFDLANQLEKSPRGEYEVTDINNEYLKQGTMDIVEYKDWWIDMGVFDGLQKAGKMERSKAWRL